MSVRDLNFPGRGRSVKVLVKYQLSCQVEGDTAPNMNWGSILHGVLIDSLSEKLKEEFHTENVRPFSQYVVPAQNQSFTWHIGIVGTLAQEIAQILDKAQELRIEHKNLTVKISDRITESITEKDLCEKYLASKSTTNRWEIQFLTPCTHKSQGKYVLYPQVDLIFQSLMNHYAPFAETITVDDIEVLKHITENSMITNYFLRSHRFFVEDNKILGYTGKIQITSFGPEPLLRYISLLLSLAEYTGIGIKTALGMGGCRNAG
jgi:CRISPR-associated endoribonuclease Cas6